MAEYVINLLSNEHKKSSSTFNDYGFYQGRLYTVSFEKYPLHSGNQIDEKVKRYTSEQRAINSANSVMDKCGYVNGYQIYKIEGSKRTLVYVH